MKPIALKDIHKFTVAEIKRMVPVSKTVVILPPPAKSLNPYYLNCRNRKWKVA